MAAAPPVGAMSSADSYL